MCVIYKKNQHISRMNLIKKVMEIFFFFFSTLPTEHMSKSNLTLLVNNDRRTMVSDEENEAEK